MNVRVTIANVSKSTNQLESRTRKTNPKRKHTQKNKIPKHSKTNDIGPI